jgi:hypothetical protein
MLVSTLALILIKGIYLTVNYIKIFALKAYFLNKYTLNSFLITLIN